MMYPILNYSNVVESNGIKVKNDTDPRGHFSVFSYALDTQGFHGFGDGPPNLSTSCKSEPYPTGEQYGWMEHTGSLTK